MPRVLFAAPLLFALIAHAASAQEVRLYRSDDAVDPQEVARILAAPAAPAFKTRSIKMIDDPKPEAATALSLPVQFAFDSAEILPVAREQLDALAKGIGMLPAATSVVIEGHTDAIGPVHYNELLSERRAYSVKHYLVAVHGIDPARLHPVGLGESVPLPGRDPYAPENRRVQFHGE
jgi:outer membrane protein OmpA-like peptidoglycan-associated protein